MGDDLVKRLYDRRVCSPAQNSCRNDLALEQAADRIEELEANAMANRVARLMPTMVGHTIRTIGQKVRAGEDV